VVYDRDVAALVETLELVLASGAQRVRITAVERITAPAVATGLPRSRSVSPTRRAISTRLQGTVKTQFFIDARGQVTSVSAHGVDPTVASCIAAVIAAIEFPAPGGGGVQVNYPFTLRTP